MLERMTTRATKKVRDATTARGLLLADGGDVRRDLLLPPSFCIRDHCGGCGCSPRDDDDDDDNDDGNGRCFMVRPELGAVVTRRTGSTSAPQMYTESLSANLFFSSSILRMMMHIHSNHHHHAIVIVMIVI